VTRVPIRLILREAVAAAKSQRVASLATMLVVAALAGAVLLTAGRVAGIEHRVLSTIDSAASRTVVFRLEGGAGVDPSVVQRLATVADIEWLAAVGPAQDGVNAALPEGKRVPMRMVWSTDLSVFSPAAATPSPVDSPRVFLSDQAVSEFGLLEAAGAVRPLTGVALPVAGRSIVPEYLEQFEPLTLIVPVDPLERVPATSADGRGALSMIVARFADPYRIEGLLPTVVELIGADSRDKVQVGRSGSLAELRDVLSGQLSASNFTIVLGIFSVLVLVQAGILFALVLLRRRDFGRRRALGASQRLIVTMLVAQTAFLAVAGAVTGAVIAALVLAIGGDPLPALTYFLAVVVLAVLAAVAAAVLPAIVAARREPISELRVP